MTAPSTPGVPGRSRRPRRRPRCRAQPARRPRLLVLVLLLALVGCSAGTTADEASGRPTLVVGAIPDQDPQKLQRLHGLLTDHLSGELGIDVVYRPVTDYAAAVSLFRTGDLQLVWFGGLTGVQARLQTPGAVPLVQRDIDRDFHSVFLASTGARLDPVDRLAELSVLRGRRFTYGSPSSTSGYLMPAHFLSRAGVDPERDFAAAPGFSGSHDKTIDLVASGTYEAGVVNEQVWKARLAAGTVDPSKVGVLYRTPAYADYHWVLGPRAREQFGSDIAERVSRALLDLDAGTPAEAEILALFGAQRFVPTSASAYAQIEDVGRRLGLIAP